MKALIMAGGTGGHVFPALAVAQELQADGWQIHWLGSQGGMEVELVGKNGIAISTIPVSGLRGKGVAGLLAAPLRLLRSLRGALAVIHREKPQVVVGFGGFASGPGGVAARVAGIPLVVHEQNAFAGMTNKLLARIAARVLVAFPQAAQQLPRAEVVGNPVRAAILAVPEPSVRFAARESDGLLRLLVVGGSLGAQALNTLVPAALSMLPGDMRIAVKHQTGRKHVDETKANYTRVGIDAEVLAFIDDMASAYAWADLVVCRAGALTVSELAAVGVPSILIPFPHAVDDHQTHNGMYLVNAGAAQLVQQAALDPALLSQKIVAMSKPEIRNTMANAARKASFGDAARVIANIVKKIALKEVAA